MIIIAALVSLVLPSAPTDDWWPQMGTEEMIVLVALDQIGDPAEKYSADTAFWCASFVSHVMEEAEVLFWRSFESPLNMYYYSQRVGTFTKEPTRGSVAFIDLFQGAQPGAPITHVGVVVHIDGEEIVTIEGNNKSDPIHVTVQRRSLLSREFVGYAKVV